MQFTISLKKNNGFRRVYSSGKSAVTSLLAMYHKKNRFGQNRLGFTVGTKVGNAVIRNRVRRKLKEIYRLHESELKCGYDIVVVARVRSREADYSTLETDMLKLFEKLGLLKS